MGLPGGRHTPWRAVVVSGGRRGQANKRAPAYLGTMPRICLHCAAPAPCQGGGAPEAEAAMAVGRAAAGKVSTPASWRRPGRPESITCVDPR